MAVLNKFKSLITNRQLLQNFVFLALLQGINYLAPFLVIGYLTKVFGVQVYGRIATAQMLAVFCSLAAEYGFNLSATRKVSVLRHQHHQLSEYVNAVYGAKLLTTILATILFFGIYTILASTKLSAPDLHLYMGGALLIWGNYLLPVWFFQGIEKMRLITIFSGLAKMGYVGLVFFTLNPDNGYQFVNYYLSGTLILAGMGSVILLGIQYKIKFRLANRSSIFGCLSEGFGAFVTNFSSNLYTNLSVVILSFFASDAVVGMFSIAERLIFAVRQLVVVVFSSVYPHYCKLAIDQTEKSFLLKLTQMAFVLFSLITLGLYVFGKFAIGILGDGSVSAISVSSLYIMAPMALIIGLNVPPFLVLLGRGYHKYYSVLYMLIASLNLVLSFTFMRLWGATGAAITALTTEVLLTSALYWVVWNFVPQHKFIGK